MSNSAGAGGRTDRTEPQAGDTAVPGVPGNRVPAPRAPRSPGQSGEPDGRDFDDPRSPGQSGEPDGRDFDDPRSPGRTGKPDGQDSFDATVVALTSPDLPQSQRRRLLGRLAGQVRARGLKDLFMPRSAARWISDAVSEVAPRIPIRSAVQLRAHHPGLDDHELAERLVRDAARLTAAVGAAGGGLAAVEWVATPTLLTSPVLLASETIAVVAIEIKLIGELHELYGRPIPGSGTHRAVALVQAWARRRGVNSLAPGVAMTTALGTAARKELRDRLLRRFGRNMTSLGPFLTGAAVAAYLNRRATLSLAKEVRRDLRQRAIGPGPLA